MSDDEEVQDRTRQKLQTCHTRQQPEHRSPRRGDRQSDVHRQQPPHGIRRPVRALTYTHQMHIPEGRGGRDDKLITQ